MRLIELFEARAKKAQVPTPRNPVAKNMKHSGAGAHTPNKYTRKTKHKSRDDSV